MSELSPEAKLSDVALRWPETVGVFAKYNLDLCCGGGHSLSVAAHKHNLDLQRLLNELNEVIESHAAVK